jgi:hypothetical protein
MPLRHIDKPTDSRIAVVGADAVSLAADVLCLGRGLKHHDVDVALTEMFEARAGVARELYKLLWSDFGAGIPIPVAQDLFLIATLRYRTNNGFVPGLVAFLDRCAAGDLERALRRLSSFGSNVVDAAPGVPPISVGLIPLGLIRA